MSEFNIGDLVQYAEGQDAHGSGLIGVVISPVHFRVAGGGTDPWPEAVHVRFPGATGLLGRHGDLDRGGVECWEHYEQPEGEQAFDAGESDDDSEAITISVTHSVTIIKS